jgi:hypothetical protein
MLAIKLHKNKKPWLGKSSFLIPIVSWNTGKIHIKNWIKLLQERPTFYGKKLIQNNRINYITLVKIPEDHPVSIFHTPTSKMGVNLKNPDFPQLKSQGKYFEDGYWWDDNRQRLKLSFEDGPADTWPEMILGKKLPDSCIKWTKDIRLLYKPGKDVKLKL